MEHADVGLPFPDGKRFVFTIIDDTDVATLSNVKPVYDLLHECGLRHHQNRVAISVARHRQFVCRLGYTRRSSAHSAFRAGTGGARV